MQRHQPFGQRRGGRRFHRAVGDVAQAIALSHDHTPPRRRQTGVEAEDQPHGLPGAPLDSVTNVSLRSFQPVGVGTHTARYSPLNRPVRLPPDQ